MITTAAERPQPECRVQVRSLNIKNMCKKIFKTKLLVRNTQERYDTLLFLNFLHPSGRWCCQRMQRKKLETKVHQVMWETGGGAAK